MLITPHMRELAQFPEVLDSTMMLKSSCPIKFFYEHCLNLTNTTKSIHLHAGGAFAYALENTRRAFYSEEKGLEQSLFYGWKKLIDYWGDYEAPEGSYKDFANVSAAFFDYFHVYNPESDHIQPYRKHDGTPAVEFTFSIPLPINHPVTGNPLIYGGRCDMIGVINEMPCIVDEKTTYTFSADWSKNFSMRGQFLGYTYAAQFFKIPANICVVRGVGIQQRAIKHLEAILTYPQWQVDRWYEEMLYKVQMLINSWETGYFPMNYGDACSSYGGCQMMDLCNAKNPEVWFDSFERRVWNPLVKEDN